MPTIFEDIIICFVMLFVMGEWLRVLASMIEERKGTYLVKKKKFLLMSEKADGFLQVTVDNRKILTRHRYAEHLPLVVSNNGRL